MKKELVAIQTRYKGCNFRSRLEARYAVYLDELGWEWEYEPEGYVLPSGWYLPDFYFPDINCYAEVKPKFLNKLELKICCELSEAICEEQTSIDVILFEGTPDYKTFRSISNGALFGEVVPIAFKNKYYPFFFCGSPEFNKEYFWQEGEALIKGKEARFEHESRSKD